MPKSGRIMRPDWAESENPWKYGGLTRVLNIDDLASAPTEIAVDQNRSDDFTSLVLTSSDYELLPRNAALGPEAKPYTQVELTAWGAVYAWPRDARVRITGVWGWPAVPEAIKRATVELTAILRTESPRATRTITDLGQVTGMSSRGASIVDDLMIHYGKVSF